MFQINHTTHSPARMPDAARMGNREGAAGVDKGADAEAGEDDDACRGDGDDASCRYVVCSLCMYNI